MLLGALICLYSSVWASTFVFNVVPVLAASVWSVLTGFGTLGVDLVEGLFLASSGIVQAVNGAVFDLVTWTSTELAQASHNLTASDPSFLQQMMTGNLLGDGSLVKKYVGGGTYFKIAQSAMHAEYLQ